jgi:hypothetical protein
MDAEPRRIEESLLQPVRAKEEETNPRAAGPSHVG